MRTLLATFYDGLIILSFMILLSFPIIVFNHGQAVPPGDKRYVAFLLTVAFCYLWGMTKLSGQTLGMKAWRMHYQFCNAKRLWIRLLIRYFLFLPVSLFCLFNAQKRENQLKKYCGIIKYLQN
ncbi:hypothetical protein [Legionella sp. W05-934-2]|uniref:hypothetical protein n=1 Tax=Legionella sp. W05-934-2 TaxID=1198649 RepID=UPI00346292D4